MSLDALRGFDMFWIMGADALGGVAARMAESLGGSVAPGAAEPWYRKLADQLEHVEWRGFHFYDLIFPLFVFMAGVSMVYSLGRTVAEEGRGAATWRLFRRALLLWLLGVLYYRGWANGLDHVRLLGVLQRIALAYLGAGLCFIHLKPRGWIAVLGGILLGYWALLALAPVRDIQLTDAALKVLSEKTGQTDPHALFLATTRVVHRVYEPGYNVVNHFDFQYLPWRKWDKYHDPEGILSTFPAVASCLLGMFAGWFLKDEKRTPVRRAATLLVAGVVLVALGWAWDSQFPVIKKLWTSSYVLVAGGYSALLLGAFYYLVDVRGWQRWCQPFVWIGLNPIAVYLAGNLVNFDNLAQRVAGGPVAAFFDGWVPNLGSLVLALAGMGWAVLFARSLHRRRLYFRL